MTDKAGNKLSSLPRKGGFFFSIRSKMLFYFGLLFVVMLVVLRVVEFYGIPFGIYEGEYSALESEILKQLNLVADLKKERLLRWIKERKDDARVLAESSLIGASVAELRGVIQQSVAGGLRGDELWGRVRKEEVYIHLIEHLSLVETAYEVYDAIQIADAATGRIIASTRSSDLGMNVSLAAFPADFLNSDDLRMIVEKTPGGSKSYLTITRPMRGSDALTGDNETKVGAAVIMHVSPDDFIAPMLHTGGGLGQTGEALLVNRDGTILTSLKHPLADGTRARPLEYRCKAQPAVLAARGEEGIIETEDYRGVSVLAAYRHIPVTPEGGWGMVVKRDRAEVFALLQGSVVYTSVFALIGVIVVIGFTFVFSRNLTRPINSLSRTANKVAEGDLDVQAPVITSDEVGQLSMTFNAMIQHIKKHTTELAVINQELESFSYSVSHDLRAPLRGIDGFSQALIEDYSEKLDDQGKDYLRRLRAASQRMAQLIDDLLSLSRVARGEMLSEAVDLSSLVHSIAANLQRGGPEHEVEFVIADGLLANGDARLLRVALENLLENAWKFSGKRSRARIEFGVTEHDGKPVYFVRDSGVGFDMAYADKLFVPFQRLHAMDEFAGTGIGLATVKRIIHRHGGRVWAEGEVGRGATFYFTL